VFLNFFINKNILSLFISVIMQNKKLNSASLHKKNKDVQCMPSLSAFGSMNEDKALNLEEALNFDQTRQLSIVEGVTYCA
jgi:hypothetical protein